MDSENWRGVIEAEWLSRREQDAPMQGKALFPLAANPFGVEEIVAMTVVLLSGRLTLGEMPAFSTMCRSR